MIVYDFFFKAFDNENNCNTFNPKCKIPIENLRWDPRVHLNAAIYCNSWAGQKTHHCLTVSSWLCVMALICLQQFCQSFKNECLSDLFMFTCYMQACFHISAPPPWTINYRNRLPPALGVRIWFLTKCLLRDYVGFDMSSDTEVLFLTVPPMISYTVDVYLLFVLFILCWWKHEVPSVFSL